MDFANLLHPRGVCTAHTPSTTFSSGPAWLVWVLWCGGCKLSSSREFSKIACTKESKFCLNSYQRWSWQQSNSNAKAKVWVAFIFREIGATAWRAEFSNILGRFAPAFYKQFVPSTFKSNCFCDFQFVLRNPGCCVGNSNLNGNLRFGKKLKSPQCSARGLKISGLVWLGFTWQAPSEWLHLKFLFLCSSLWRSKIWRFFKFSQGEDTFMVSYIFTCHFGSGKFSQFWAGIC